MIKPSENEKGQEESAAISSVFCFLQGDQTKCWVQNLQLVYSALPLEDAKLIFEIYNIAHGEYAKAASDDMDTSYSGLFGLDNEIIAARKLMKSNKEINKKYLIGSDGDDEDSPRITFANILSSNPTRYATVKKYFADFSEDDDCSFNFAILPIKTETYYWINLCRVSEVEYGRYTSELHHVYAVVELFDPADIPFDLNDPATVSIFGSNQFKALADLSYGC